MVVRRTTKSVFLDVRRLFCCPRRTDNQNLERFFLAYKKKVSFGYRFMVVRRLCVSIFGCPATFLVVPGTRTTKISNGGRVILSSFQTQDSLLQPHSLYCSCKQQRFIGSSAKKKSLQLFLKISCFL